MPSFVEIIARFTIRYLIFVGVTMGASIFIGAIIGWSVGLPLWKLIQNETTGWSESEFWEETHYRILLWSSIVSWLAIIVGWFFVHDLAFILIFTVAIAFTTGSIVVISTSVDRLHTIPSLGTIRKLEKFPIIYINTFIFTFLLVGYVMWIFLQLLLFDLPPATRRAVYSDMALLVFLSFSPIIIVLFWMLGVVFLIPLMEQLNEYTKQISQRFIRIRDEQDRELIENHSKEFEHYTNYTLYLIAFAIFLGFLTLFLAPAVGITYFDNISPTAAVTWVLYLIELFFLAITIISIKQLEQLDLSSNIVNKYILRSLIKNLVVFVTAIPFVIIFLLPLDWIIHWHLTHILSDMISYISPNTIELLSDRPEILQPTGFIESFDVISSYQSLRSLVIQMFLNLVIPAVAVFSVTPPLTAYIYFKPARSLLSMAVTFVGFTLLNLVIEFSLMGDISRIQRATLWSLVPTVLANFGQEIAGWILGVWGYVDCPECDRQIEGDSRYCQYCGTNLQTCPHCRSVIKRELDVCTVCDGELTA